MAKAKSKLHIRLDFDSPGRDGRLVVGFRSISTTFVRKGLDDGMRSPLNMRAKYSRRPMVMFFNCECFPSGRFDDGLSGGRRVKPTREQIVGFTQYVHNWMVELNKKAPILAAWGWSGKHSEVRRDPAFATAWLDVMESLGKQTDAVIDREPELLLLRVQDELPRAQRARAEDIIEVRRKAWNGNLIPPK